MPDLGTLQRAFAAAIVAADVRDADVSTLEGDVDRVRARLGLYRGNVQANAAKALANAYPVVAKLVGDDFFGGLARAYAARVPSTSGDLNEYGDRFAEFVAAFGPARDLAYLADVARLEWRVHRAHYAGDAGPLDVAKLAAVAPERAGDVRLVPHPAAAIVESRWPLARLWRIHQHDYDGALDVDWDAGGAVLVSRPRWRVDVHAVDAAAAAFVTACAERATLAEALACAQTRDAAFDLDEHLVDWVRELVIVDAVVPQ